MVAEWGRQRLLVFAKAPVAGQVKTRLQPLLSAAQSARLHERLIQHCLQQLSLTERWQLELWVGSAHACWSQMCEDFSGELFYQQGEDLGARLSHALTNTLERADKVIVVGTDCPSLNQQTLFAAFAALDNYDVVVGPANDGGYVLLAMKAPSPSLFQGISWGGDQVLAQTLDRIRALGLSYCELPSMSDIDRPEDFLQLQKTMPALTVDIAPAGLK
ncbi:TIGR04282 family arsenosugar biosynthesis glycosyltransferase [Oceanicoccus sp. KOV_DT_Chl]|uniref:TIGR04282 family arsenosugar biosynthesis glycosyltransferase n=1 Tax=Oceanicoccus sp. KOV_DT_Chl TaxID=1904639 RepID=UPI000C7D02BD|nr:TIGR04282 family arsenosugar biosynthesis glycosyltransferase [Oceanicoccus sp. KOV_DT_Chl]